MVEVTRLNYLTTDPRIEQVARQRVRSPRQSFGRHTIRKSFAGRYTALLDFTATMVQPVLSENVWEEYRRSEKVNKRDLS